MKRIIAISSIVTFLVLTSCVTSKNTVNTFPGSFEEAEIYMDSLFKPYPITVEYITESNSTNRIY